MFSTLILVVRIALEVIGALAVCVIAVVGLICYAQAKMDEAVEEL